MRVYGALVLAGSFVATVFAACAEGSSIDTGTGGSPATTATAGGSGGEGGGGIPFGEVGGPCETQQDCHEGTCTQVGDGKFCTVPCPPDCPDGTYCAIIQGDSICVPDLDVQCAQCASTPDCKAPAHECLEAPAGDKFCARDCTTLGSCPNGFTCVVGSEYPGGGGSGGSDAGTDAGPDAADAGNGGSGGGGKPSGPYKFCVPSGNLSCPCNEKRDGVKHDCSQQNAFGACNGTETCNGDTAKWSTCTATIPAAETCNGKDDNCDSMKDEGDPNALCAGEGQPPPHASWACVGGQCQLGVCDPGWAAYPTGMASDGCTCPTEPGENNNTCAAATGAGMVSDNGTFLDITGTLSGANDVDFWVFDTVDIDEVTTNSYHVSIDFTEPVANNEFQFDVMRGDVCTDAPSGPTTALTSYDWCVDGTNGPTEGELVCSATGPIHCNNNSSKYYLRVFRKMGATGTCSEYKLHVTAKGGDPCDFTSKCP